MTRSTNKSAQQKKKPTKAQKNTVKRTKSIQDVIDQAKSIQQKKLPVTKKIQKQEQQPQKQQKKKDTEAKEQKQQQQQKQQKKTQKNNIKKNVSNSSFRNKRFTEEEIPKYINMEELQEGIHELDENHNFRERFLGKEGAFSAYKILIGCFSNGGMVSDVHKTVGEELKRRGFQYEVCNDFDKFTKILNDYDIVWLVSTCTDRQNKQETDLIQAMDKFFKAKKSLFLWADNTPYVKEANIVLNKFFNGMKMEGNYIGQQKLVKNEKNDKKVQKGTFDNSHSISYGLNNLHEGVTICHPENMHEDFKTFAVNTNNEPCVLYTEENENHGRIIVDTGFTKLYTNFWSGVGTHQYVSNANVWLTGIPM